MIILEPKEGWITQNREVPLEERVFSKKVYLAINDSEDNWTEITEEQYQEYQKQLEDEDTKQERDIYNEGEGQA